MTRWRKQAFQKRKKSDQYVRNSRLLANLWSGYRTADEHNYFCEKSPVIPHIEADDAQTINHDGLVYFQNRQAATFLSLSTTWTILGNAFDLDDKVRRITCTCYHTSLHSYILY